MHTLPLFVVVGALVFIYRKYSPVNQPNILLHKFQRRLRAWLGAFIFVVLVLIGYTVPASVGHLLTSIQANQLDQIAQRQEARQASELRHVRAMIEALGGPDNYLAYEKRRRAL